MTRGAFLVQLAITHQLGLRTPVLYGLTKNRVF